MLQGLPQFRQGAFSCHVAACCWAQPGTTRHQWHAAALGTVFELLPGLVLLEVLLAVLPGAAGAVWAQKVHFQKVVLLQVLLLVLLQVHRQVLPAVFLGFRVFFRVLGF